MDDKRTMNQYWLLMNNIAYWLVKNNKKFNTRQVYGYQGREADYGTIIRTIKERGSNTQPDSLIAEFVECAINDNKDLSFLPNYVAEPYNNGNKLSRDVYVDMARRVSEWEVKHNGQSPNYVTVKATGGNTTNNNKLHNYLTTSGCAGMGQCTPYYCACNSLQQAFYRLTGIHISESTIASVAGTTTSGTGHQGINTAVAWFNRKYGQNIKITWKNFNDLGSSDSARWNKLNQYASNGAVFCHILYRNKWGHYEVLKSVNGNNVTVLNSLGNRCNKPAYCGYIETRSKSNQRSYMRGISQQSVAILTK
jgi:hypothetical protein